MRRDRQEPHLAWPRGHLQPDLSLNHHYQRLRTALRLQEATNDTRRRIIRQIGDNLVFARGAKQNVDVYRPCVSLDDLDVLGVAEHILQQCDERAIQLDGRNPPRPFCKRPSEKPAPRPNLHDGVIMHKIRCIDDSSPHSTVDQKVLAERLLCP